MGMNQIFSTLKISPSKEGHEALAFLTDCPATPLTHILALEDGSQAGYGNGLVDITLYLTRACNLRCKTCYISAGRPLRAELEIKDWNRVLEGIKELGAEIVYLLGGEPLVKKGLLQIISHAKQLGLYIALSSNGTLINASVAKSLKTAGLDQIQISVDGPSVGVNDAIRGQGVFWKALRAIKYLTEAQIKVSLSCTVTPINADFVGNMITLAERLGVKVVNFGLVQLFGRAHENNMELSRECSSDVLDYLLSVRTPLTLTFNSFRFSLKAFNASFNSAIKVLKTSYHSCPAGRERFVIDSDGGIYGCELLINPSFYEGNVQGRHLKEVWLNGFKQFRERRGQQIFPCKTCAFATLCQGGCPARAYQASGTLNVPDPYCSFIKN